MKNTTLIFLFLSAAVCTLSGQAYDLTNYTWSVIEAKGEAVPRHENVFVEFEDKFYLIGGRGINPVNVFDPKTNTWETKGESPFEIHHFQPVVYKDAIYFVGAMSGQYPKEMPLEHIWKYYPGKDEWVKGDEIPEQYRRGGAGAVLHDDKIYIACGIEYGHTSGTTNRFDCYDLKTGKWTSLTKAPHIRDHFSAIVVNNKLYCIGGRNTSVHHEGYFMAFFDAIIPQVDVYDFESGIWLTLKNNLPLGTAAGGIVSMGDNILYFGGEGVQKQAYSNTQCLNIASGEWSELAPLNIGRHGTGAIKYNGKIYIAAGSPVQGGGNINSIEVFSVE